MTRDDIIKWAREAREQTMKELPPNTFDLDLFHERFAALVAAQERERIKESNAPVIKTINEHIKALEEARKAEREACAKVCEDDPSKAGEWPVDAPTGGYYAEIIRARGQA